MGVVAVPRRKVLPSPRSGVAATSPHRQRAAGQEHLKIYDGTTGQCLRILSTSGTIIGFLLLEGLGRIVTLTKKNIEVWDLRTAGEMFVLLGLDHTDEARSSSPCSVALLSCAARPCAVTRVSQAENSAPDICETASKPAIAYIAHELDGMVSRVVVFVASCAAEPRMEAHFWAASQTSARLWSLEDMCHLECVVGISQDVPPPASRASACDQKQARLKEICCFTHRGRMEEPSPESARGQVHAQLVVGLGFGFGRPCLGACIAGSLSMGLGPSARQL